MSVKLDEYYIKNDQFILTAEPGYRFIPSMKEWLYEEIKNIDQFGEFFLDENRFAFLRKEK